jgi:hypothetical protein
MKPKLFAAILLFPVVLLYGHTKTVRSFYGAVSSGGVGFSLGDGWHRDKSVSANALYPVRFVGQAGVTRVILLNSELCDPLVAAAGIRTGFDSNPQAVKGSYVQERFISDSGLRGIHVCFRQRAENTGEQTVTQCHHSLVRNQCGRCVAVNFLADAHGDAATVDQMIRSTLSLR